MDEIRLIAALSLGLLCGALLTEAAVLVPFWRTMSAQEFGELHARMASRLYSYFAPLTVCTVLLAVVSGVHAAMVSHPGSDRGFMICSAALAVSLLGFYRWYFEAANRNLPSLARLDDSSRLATELRRWQVVHICRTVVSAASFACALLSL